MPVTDTTRSAFFRQAFWRPMVAVVMLPYALLGLALLVRDEFIQPANATKWKVPYLVSLVPVSIWVAIAFAVTLAVMFEGAFRVTRKLHERIAVLEALDVRLEGTFPGTFALHAYGHACEIQTGSIIIEPAVIATERFGDQILPVVNPRCTIEFPLVADLRNGEKTIEPSLFYDEAGGHRRWPHDGMSAVMIEFFDAAMLARRYRAAQSVLGRDDFDLDFITLSRPELEAIGDRMQQPFEFGFEITFWNSDHTQQWRRSEILACSPKGAAFVQHPGRPVVITPSEAVTRGAS